MIIALLGLIIMAFILFSTGGDTQTMKYSEVIDYFEQGATNIARQMVLDYGFSEKLGAIKWSDDEQSDSTPRNTWM